jgi:hypothetical protein
MMPTDLGALGAEGWELCGIVGGYGWSKRSTIARCCTRRVSAMRRKDAVERLGPVPISVVPRQNLAAMYSP